MNLRNRKRLLWAANAALLAGMVAALVLAMAPLARPDDHAVVSGVRPHAAGGAARSLPPLEAYAAAWARPLRRPLYDRPVARPAPAAATPLPAIELSGTAADAQGAGCAFFRTGDGHMHLVRIGEGLLGVRLVAVRDSAVTVAYQGREETLQIKREVPAP